jgi:threonine dehydrogenase-like Zn-dependent dehydrogenase
MTGDYAQCVDYDYFGSRRNGAFAEFLYVPEENLISVPDHVDLINAAMAEPCAVALHGVRRMAVKAGSFGAVFGAGPIGLMVAQWLRISGCGQVAIVDIDTAKLSIGETLGFIPVNPTERDPVSFIKNLCGGGVIEACGLPNISSIITMCATRQRWFSWVIFMEHLVEIALMFFVGN